MSSLTGLFVIYIYPMTGRPGVPLPDGWDGIPGRADVPQSCNFRDHYTELKALGSGVFGVSAQDSDTNERPATACSFPFNCSATAPPAEERFAPADVSC